MKSPRRTLAGLLMLLSVVASLFGLATDLPAERGDRPAAMPGNEPFLSGIAPNSGKVAGRGPIVFQTSAPYVWNGDLRDLQPPTETFPYLEMPRPGQSKGRPEQGVDRIDPVAQTHLGAGQMPAPIANFDGLYIADGGGWHPPDTDGDVGPNHYIQVVNIAIGIYDKSGNLLVKMPYDTFFQGPPGSACDNQNRGDVTVNYDPLADRWIVADFSFPGNESRECIAVSQTGDPVSGGWYFYDFDTKDPTYGSWCDYPKIGVWPDGYYLTCNMFDPWIGANVFALDRAAMLSGAPATAVMFGTGSAYASLLPANLRGTPPPAGAPNYMVSVDFAGLLRIWEFHVDWANPNNSTFTGPVDLPVAPFGYIDSVPQRGVSQEVDTIGDRLMYLLQYRNYGDHEALFVNHTVPSGGVAGVRWYEVRDPGGSPYVYQQGTFQPDSHYRWMGSIAADRDGNLALGYSVSSSSLYPSIRYTGRLNGEILGQMTQGEASLIEGSGSQTGSNRWGDYSAMSVDPVDDCTFWYTQMYFKFTSGTWYTRIGSFKFPSCGLPKGQIVGTVYNAATLQPIAGVPVVGVGTTIALTMTVETDPSGVFTMAVPAGDYNLTAGPLLPGYPGQDTATATVTAGETTYVSMYLDPYPYLTGGAVLIDDAVPGGNANGYPEPGETGLLFWQTITNVGAVTATGVSGHLVSLTPGLTVETSDAAYPDLGIGQAAANQSAFVISIAPTVPCGAHLELEMVVSSNEGVFTIPAGLRALVVLPLETLLYDWESGPAGWTTGGAGNAWAITTENPHSPSRSWSDSPYGNYANNKNAWLRSPVLNLTGTIGTQVSFWHDYDTEAGWDYAYVEYSTDGGANWMMFPVQYTGNSGGYIQETLAAPFFDDLANTALRFRLQSDTYVVADGWYIDDVAISYHPYACFYMPAVPVLLSPPDNTITSSHEVTLTWAPGDAVPVEYYQVNVDGAVFTTTQTSAAVVLATGVHTWTVSACAGGCSAYAAPRSLEIVDVPAVPVLLFPPDGTITSSHEVTLSWAPGDAVPVGYYQVDVDGAVLTTTQTSAAVVLAMGVHTWTVSACTVDCSAYAAPWSLEILDPPAVPVLLSPPDGTVTTSHAVTLTWQAGAGGPPGGYNLELDGVVLTTTEALYAADLSTGAHAWRVRAYNASGYSDYSDLWTLTVVDPPGVPVPLSPADGTLTATRTITFTWQAGSGGTPDGYNLELDGQAYTSTVPFYVTTLGPGTHTWRVRAYNLAGRSDYSDSWTVTVVYQVYLPVILKH